MVRAPRLIVVGNQSLGLGPDCTEVNVLNRNIEGDQDQAGAHSECRTSPCGPMKNSQNCTEILARKFWPKTFFQSPLYFQPGDEILITSRSLVRFSIRARARGGGTLYHGWEWGSARPPVRSPGQDTGVPPSGRGRPRLSDLALPTRSSLLLKECMSGKGQCR